jgi:hypothetical protein
VAGNESIAAVVHTPNLIRARANDESFRVANARNKELFVLTVEIVRPDLLPVGGRLVGDIAAVADARVQAPLIDEDRSPPVAAFGQLAVGNHRQLPVRDTVTVHVTAFKAAHENQSPATRQAVAVVRSASYASNGSA